MAKIIKMNVDTDEEIKHKFFEYSQRQINIERLKILINKLGIPNKRELISNIKKEQNNHIE